ncbi:MAG: SGNH/GDSL hydrolase family protein [Bacteroidota bacterium]
MFKFKNPFVPIVLILILLVTCKTLYSYIHKPLLVVKQKPPRTLVADSLRPVRILRENISEKESPNHVTDYFLFDTAPMLAFNANPQQTVDTTKQRFLLIGDSMLEGLGPRMNDYCLKNGHECKQVIWYSSSTYWYGNCDTIRHFVNQYKPTYVVLVIGSMELFIRNIKEERKQYVVNILNQLSGTKYIWVGPPNWTDDTGINDLLSNTVDSGTFFLSKNLSFDRCSDGVHPTRASASRWMDSIATFMMTKCAHPVVMKFPDEKAKRNPLTTILNPNPPQNI